MVEDRYRHFESKGVARWCSIHHTWYDVRTGCIQCQSGQSIPQEPNVKAKKKWWVRSKRISAKKLKELKDKYNSENKE